MQRVRSCLELSGAEPATLNSETFRWPQVATPSSFCRMVWLVVPNRGGYWKRGISDSEPPSLFCSLALVVLRRISWCLGGFLALFPKEIMGSAETENPWFGGFACFVTFRNVPVTPTPSIFPKVLPYKWGAYCRTNGRRTAVQMGGVLQGFPFFEA